MAAIKRRVYPRCKPADYHAQALNVFKAILERINLMAQQDIRIDIMRLNFMVQFKIFQALHYFIEVEHVPKPTISIISQVFKYKLWVINHG